MTNSIFSPAWYRVAHLKPRIRGHSQIHRQLYRDELWYVLQDHVSGRFYRFSPIIYRFIGLMDGKRRVQDIWERVCEYYGDKAPGQMEIVRLLSQLHSADVLICDVPPNSEEIFRRAKTIKSRTFWGKIRSPLAVRFPLFDPERFLNVTRIAGDIAFSKFGLLLWLSVVVLAIIQGGLHWQELTADIADRVLTQENLLILWFIYPAVKGLHELGHGYAVKRWGGEVHEIGIMLLVFMPIPYVDASAASAFRQKYKRVIVGAAGILVELFLASIAMFVWVLTDPGLARTVAYNIIIIGGVSTVLFNGNPLLRYDGYYILMDILNIPNLAQRSLQYLGYLTNRYLLRVKEAPKPYTGPGETFWFIAFGITSFVYRLFVYAAIILFVAGKFFFIGVMLAILGVYNMVVMPLSKRLHTLLTAPLYRENRGQAVLIVSSFLLMVAALLFVVPLPYMTITEGVIWAPPDSLVRAGTDGVITQVSRPSGTKVSMGDTLLVMEDPYLQLQGDILSHQLKEFSLRRDAAYAEDRVTAEMIDLEITTIREKLAWIAEQQSSMEILSEKPGTFFLPKAEDIQDRFVHKGELLGYVLDEESALIRLVVPQDTADLIRNRTRHVSLRVVSNIQQVLSGQVVREYPSALDRLPSQALGVTGGGDIAVDPYDRFGNKTFENIFQFDIQLAKPLRLSGMGSRVYVRFNLGNTPLALQWYRSLRQLLLKRFNV